MFYLIAVTVCVSVWEGVTRLSDGEAEIDLGQCGRERGNWQGGKKRR